MEENINIINFEKVHDNEIEDIWDIFFSPSRARETKVSERKDRIQIVDHSGKSKPRRYMKFLFMSF